MKNSTLTIILFLCYVQIIAQENIVFEDNFNSGTTKNWIIEPSKNFEPKIENGVLVFNNLSAKSYKTIQGTTTIDFTKNFKIEYKVKSISGKTSNAIKLWFNKSDDAKNSQNFSFAVNGNWIYEYYKNNNYEASSGWNKTQIIKEKDWNYIKIIKLQDKIYVEINNKLVLIKDDELLNGNKIAFSTYGSQIIHIDDFKVSYITNYKIPEKDNSFILQGEEKLAQVEDFSNTLNNLKPNIKDDWQITNPNGELLIINETDKLSVQKFFKNINYSKDFVISYEAQYKSGSINSIIYGRVYNKSQNIYFGFSKKNKTFFKIVKNNKNTTNEFIRSSYLNHNSKNLLKLEKIKNILFFSINGKILQKQKINGCYDIGNQISLATDAGVNATFDNLKVVEVYRSINAQNERIKWLTNKHDKDKVQDSILLKQNESQIEADEQKMIAEAEKLKIENEKIKKEQQQKKDAEIAAKYSSKINLQPYLNSNDTYFRISTKGTHLLVYNVNFHYFTVWDLSTSQQVFSYQVKNNTVFKNRKLKDIEFDWNDITNKPSIIGSAYNNYKEYFWFNGNKMLYGQQTGLNSNYGDVLSVYNNEMLTIIRKFEKDKKGKFNTSKPEFTKIQFFDFKLKKWRTYNFKDAKNAVVSNAYKKLLVCYNDKVEVYEFTNNFASYKLIKTIKNKNFVIHSFDDKQTNLVYLRRYNKNYKVVENGTFDLATNTFINKKEPNNINYTFTQSNLKVSYPKLNFKDTNNPQSKFKKVELNYNNQFIYLTADNNELSESINRKLNTYKEKAEAVEKKKSLEKSAKNEAQLNQLMSKLKRFGSSYKFNYANFDYIQIGNDPFVKASNYNTTIDLKAIGKFCDDTSGHFGTTKVLAVTTKKSGSGVGEQYVFKLLSFGESGVISKTIGVTQKVRGNVTQLANLSLIKGSNGYTITVNTEGRTKTINVKSMCR